MEKNNNYIKYFAIIGVLLFCILSYTLNSLFHFDKTILDLVDLAVTIDLIIWLLYSKLLWKYNPFEKVPKIYGKYEMEFVSTFDRKERIRTMNVEIKQDLLSTRVYVLTNESTSKPIISSFVYGEDFIELYYCYENTPNSKERNHSEIHNGTCKILIEKNSMIRGSYYTDKGYSGDIRTITKIDSKGN